jgi:hypothetical protein
VILDQVGPVTVAYPDERVPWFTAALDDYLGAMYSGLVGVIVADDGDADLEVTAVFVGPAPAGVEETIASAPPPPQEPPEPEPLPVQLGRALRQIDPETATVQQVLAAIVDLFPVGPS